MMRGVVNFFFVAAALCAIAFTGCVEQSPDLTPAQREQLRDLVSETAPQPQHPLDVELDRGVRLLGYDISSETVTRGQPFTVTWYWQAAEPLAGWNLFTHLANGDGDNVKNEDGTGTVRQLYQPSRWQRGQVIKDVQQITLPADWRTDRVVVYLGLWNGPHRLAVRRGPNDGENRIRAATLEVSGPAAAAAEPARPQPPSLAAPHAGGAIAVDGRLDEPGWARAQATRPFVNTVDGSPSELAATAKVLWDDTNLYVGFDVADPLLRNTLTDRDAHLWEQDAVEIMVDPNGDGRNYYELQVSPTGNVFDTRYDSRRVPGPIGHADWNASLSTRVTARGNVNDDEDDLGYTTEIAIPWASFSSDDGAPMIAPPAGSAWRIALYVMDTMRGGQRSAGWSPTFERDFHVPARFGRVTFRAPEAAVAAAPAPVAPAEPRGPHRGIVAPGVVIRPEFLQKLQVADPRQEQIIRRGLPAAMERAHQRATTPQESAPPH